ncbi:unnamed protein product [Medioppia subpectinata]|uniref:Uncharacterized protein n=1 Tax=Medioppia subpectinata TaxID=1979941 RepID=A0A7R9KE35_9ACAR|nr:unnamed protein product [Medioppia subpectinata]CAG2100450.1 unnamed protein product [Medioppia subpectinata]
MEYHMILEILCARVGLSVGIEPAIEFQSFILNRRLIQTLIKDDICFGIDRSTKIILLIQTLIKDDICFGIDRSTKIILRIDIVLEMKETIESQGMVLSIIGPSVSDLTHRLNATTSQMYIHLYSRVFPLAILLELFSVNGMLFNIYNRQLILTFLLMLMGCTIAVVPICPNLIVFNIVGALCGYGSGGLDTALVVWIVEVWEQKSHLYLGGVEFFFGVGLCIAPIILRPYLPDFSLDDIHLNITYNSTDLNTNDSQTENNTNINTYNDSLIEIPFAINGLFLVVSAIILLILHFYRRYIPPVKQTKKITFKRPKKWELIYTTFGVFIIGIFYGFEFMVFEMLPTFIENSYLQLSAYKSALIYAIMTATFTAARGLNVLISIKFWSKNMGNGILVLFETNKHSETVLVIGLSLSNTIGGLCVCSAGITGAIFPALCGQFIDIQPTFLLYMTIILTGIVLSIIGPALSNLAFKLNVEINEISLLTLFCLLILMGCAITLLPFSTNLIYLFIAATICGYCSGGLDTGLIVWIVEIWTFESHLYLGGAEFFYGLGLCAAPLMSAYFLSNNIIDITHNHTIEAITENITENITNTNTFSDFYVEIPFVINGVLLMIASIALLIMHFYRPYIRVVETDHKQRFKCPEKWDLICITLGVLISGIFFGFEFMVFELLPTFMENSCLQLSPSKSAFIFAIMTIIFTSVRGLNFIVSIKWWSKNSIYYYLY